MIDTLKMPVNGITNPNGTTSQAPLTIALASGQLAVAQKLVNKGANLNIVDPHGRFPCSHELTLVGQTPIYLAAILPELDVAFTRFMINRGALIHTQFPTNRHPLMGAVRYIISVTVKLTLHSVGNGNMVNFLLNEIGIEPKDILFNDGSNLVHAAVRFNQLEVLYSLLTHRYGAYRYLVRFCET